MASAGFDLMPGEKMVLFSHPHWWYFWKQALGGLIVLGVTLLGVWAGGFLETTLFWVAGLGFIAWAAITIFEFVNWRTTRFAVTDQRVAYQSGFFKRKGVSIPLNRVNNVNFEQTFVARITRNGIVTIESAGETGDSVFENIPDPNNVRSIIFNQMSLYDAADSDRDAAALARAMRDEQPTSTPAQQPSSVQQRLAELDRLRDSGVISTEEYAKKRDDILGSL